MSDGRRAHGRRATIKDVARRAGVSLATVSNVVNNSKPVREETRRMVEEAIVALSYRPNPIAQSLIARRGRSPDPAVATRPRLVTVGYVSVDYVAPVEAMPSAGTRASSPRIQKLLGGPAANVAVTAAGLVDAFPLQVELLTEIGDDADSRWAMEELEARGVDASGARMRPGARLSRAIVLVAPGGTRAIVNEPLSVGDAALLEYLAREERPSPSSWVHVDGYQVAAVAPSLPEVAALGHGLSTHATGLDSGWRNCDGFHRLRAYFDLAILDREIASAVAGGVRAREELIRKIDAFINRPEPGDRGGLTVLTFGAQGAALLRQGEVPLLASAAPVDVVDTTGAGDVFAGAFLASWITDGDPVAAMTRASRAAAASVTALGALRRRIEAADLLEGEGPAS